VGALRGDGVATHILGINKVISDDSLRARWGPSRLSRKRDTPRSSAWRSRPSGALGAWMRQHLRRSVDAGAVHAVDPGLRHHDQGAVRGQQAGAVVSYNPHKPGRPSHAIHTYWIGNLRMVLDAALESGDHHAPKHSRAGLVALLEDLPRSKGRAWCAATARSA